MIRANYENAELSELFTTETLPSTVLHKSCTHQCAKKYNKENLFKEKRYDMKPLKPT